MGIYDRDYIRRPPPRGGSPIRSGVTAMRMWSANTWIIVACVAVFVIDHFTPMLPVEARTFLFQSVPRRPATAKVEGDVQLVQVSVEDANLKSHVKRFLGRPLLERSGGNQIGWVEVEPMHTLAAWLHFSTARGFMKVELWRFIGFQFLHANVWHVFFNMLGLFFFGPIVERYLGAKRYVAFYLLCGLCGAAMYLLLNLGGFIVEARYGADVAVPGLIFDSPYVPLIGASAGVFGVLMAGAFLVPDAVVLVFFFLPLRLATFAYALVALALFAVIFGRENAGGEAGHLGGAIAGFYLIRHPRHLHGFFDVVGWADPTSHHYRHRHERPPAQRRGPPAQAREVDRILDKIRESGLHSLSDHEKRVLREASQRE